MTDIFKWHPKHPDATYHGIGAATNFKRNPTMKRGMPVFEDNAYAKRGLGAATGKTKRRK